MKIVTLSLLIPVILIVPFLLRSKNPNKIITIGFGGDTMIGRGVNEVLKKKSSTYIWGNILKNLQKNDFNIVNLETTLTDYPHPIPKVFNFKSNPKNVQSLIDGDIKAINLANNHILDFGVHGLLDTIKTLDTAGIKHVGAGKNIDEATQPVIIEHNGIKVGITGFTDYEKHWAAEENKPGTNFIPIDDMQTARKQIQRIKDQVNILIASIHWGPNWPKRPSEQIRHLAHELIDAGVDIIHGHSAHVTLGIEKYKNKLIMYSTGDFVDDYSIDPIRRNDHSFLFNVTVDKTGIKKLQLIPLLLTFAQTNHAPAKDAASMIKRIQRLSAELNTHISDSGEILFD